MCADQLISLPGHLTRNEGWDVDMRQDLGAVVMECWFPAIGRLVPRQGKQMA